jgi:hypothetical protein
MIPPLTRWLPSKILHPLLLLRLVLAVVGEVLLL